MCPGRRFWLYALPLSRSEWLCPATLRASVDPCWGRKDTLMQLRLFPRWQLVPAVSPTSYFSVDAFLWTVPFQCQAQVRCQTGISLMSKGLAREGFLEIEKSREIHPLPLGARSASPTGRSLKKSPGEGHSSQT